MGGLELDLGLVFGGGFSKGLLGGLGMLEEGKRVVLYLAVVLC
jgi:hypothetical protein